jgi:hypothetical protein
MHLLAELGGGGGMMGISSGRKTQLEVIKGTDVAF